MVPAENKIHIPLLIEVRKDWRTSRTASILGTGASVLLHLLVLGILFTAYKYSSGTDDSKTMPIIQVTLAPAILNSVKGNGPVSITPSPVRKQSFSLKIADSQNPSQERKTGKPIPSANESSDIAREENQNVVLISPTAIRDSALPSTGSVIAPGPAIIEKREASAEDGKSAPVTGSTPASSLPRYLKTPPPIYPAAARMKGQEGLVLLSVSILEDGQIGQVQIKKTSGHTILDQSATTAVRSWRFEPAKTGNIARAMTVDIPIRFSLKSEDMRK